MTKKQKTNSKKGKSIFKIEEKPEKEKKIEVIKYLFDYIKIKMYNNVVL
jgi:hypothetical protein